MNIGELLAPQHLMLFLMLFVVVIPFWQIFKKAGFPPALSLVLLVPLVNIILLYVFAFMKWNVRPEPMAGPSQLNSQ